MLEIKGRANRPDELAGGLVGHPREMLNHHQTSLALFGPDANGAKRGRK
jgi:hypothetical protein